MAWDGKFRGWVAALVGTLFLAAGVTGAGAEPPAPLNPPQKVKVAYVPIMKFATMYVAAGRGLFKKYGLDVDLE
jgi:ABC-type nitrate/sulfonate/bicarbonate transport system substrate-binding protein